MLILEQSGSCKFNEVSESYIKEYVYPSHFCSWSGIYCKFASVNLLNVFFYFVILLWRKNIILTTWQKRMTKLRQLKLTQCRIRSTSSVPKKELKKYWGTSFSRTLFRARLKLRIFKILINDFYIVLPLVLWKLVALCFLNSANWILAYFIVLI